MKESAEVHKDSYANQMNLKLKFLPKISWKILNSPTVQSRRGLSNLRIVLSHLSSTAPI